MRGVLQGNGGTNAHRKPNPKDVQNTHRQTILKNIEQRLEAARLRGDERLVKQLEAERQQFI
jgi:hypothetical protein